MAQGTGPKPVCVSILPVYWLCVLFLVNLPVIARSGQPKAIDPHIAQRWDELLERTPYPYDKPLPADVRTSIDGTYVKFDPKPHPHVPCRRCPDYVPEGGIWKLQFEKGIMRIFYLQTGWRSISSYEVEGDRLQLYNDPHCTHTVGAYHWRRNDDQLVLELVKDPCAVHMRARNLTKQPWKLCQPSKEETAITGHRPVPAGCE